MSRVDKRARPAGTIPLDSESTAAEIEPKRQRKKATASVAGDAVHGQLFPENERAAPPQAPGRRYSWLEVQQAVPPLDARKPALPAQDLEEPAQRRIERHLQVLLKKNQYGEDRKQEWRTTPDEIRRHPTYVRALLAEDYHYPEWVKEKGDEVAVREVLKDAKFAAGLKYLIHSVDYLPESTLEDPAVREVLLEATKGWVSRFEKLPASLRRDETFVEAVLLIQYTQAKNVPLEGAPPSLFALLERLSLVHLAEKGELKAVPSAIRARPNLLERALTARPLLWVELDPKEKARVEPIFRDPDLLAKAIPVFAKRFEGVFYTERSPDLWADAPEAIRNDDRYLRLLLGQEPRVVPWAGLTPSRLDRIFRDPESAEGFSGYRLCQIAQHLSSETLARPHVRALIIEGLLVSTDLLKDLPLELRTDPEIIERVSDKSPRAAATYVPLDRIDAALVERIEDRLMAQWGRRMPSWGDVPEPLRGSLSLAKKLVDRWPSFELPADLRAKLEDRYRDPGVVERSIGPWVEALRGTYSKRNEVYESIPLAVRTHPKFVREAMTHYMAELIECARTPAEREAWADALRDVAFLTAEETPLLYLRRHVPEEVAERPEVRRAAAKAIPKSQVHFGDLPVAFRSDPACIRAALESNIDAIRWVPLPSPSAPSRKLVEDGWLAFIERRGDMATVPGELAADPKFIERALLRRPELIEALSAEMKAAVDAVFSNPAFYDKAAESITKIGQYIPEAHFRDDLFLSAVCRGLAKSPWSYRDLPASVKIEDRVIDALLDAAPGAISILPVQEISERALDRAKRAADDHLEKNRWNWRDIPGALASDPAFVEEHLRKRPQLMQVLVKEALELVAHVFADPEFVKSSGASLFDALSRAPASVLDDEGVRETALAAVEKEPQNYQALPEVLKLEPRAVLARVFADKRISDVIPRQALTDQLLLRLARKSPSFLQGAKRELFSAAAFEKAEALILRGVGPKTNLGGIPDAFRTAAVKSAVLRQAGLAGFDSYGVHALIHDPELFVGAPRARILEYLEKYPDRFLVVKAQAAGDPELALLSVEKARSNAARDEIVRALDPALWLDAKFVDAMMAIDPVLFGMASPELRADPERARRAILAHPANIDRARIDKKTLHAILRDVELSAPSRYGDGPWREEGMIEAVRENSTYRTMDLRTPAFAAQALSVAPKRAIDLPMEMLEDVDLVKRLSSEAPKALSAWPLEHLSSGPRAKIEAWMRARVAEDPSTFEHLPASLRSDRALAEMAQARFPAAILHVEGALANDPDLWRRALDGDARLFQHCKLSSPDLTEYAVRAAVDQVRRRIIAPREIPKALYSASNDVAQAAIEGWGGYGASWFEQWLKYGPIQDSVRRMIESAPQRLVDGLDKMPPDLVRILERMPPDPTGGPNRGALRFAIALADRAPSLVNELPSQLRQHPSVRDVAWDIDPPRGAVLSVTGAEARKRIVQKRPSAISELAVGQRTRELMLAAVELEGGLLRFAPEGLRDDPEVVRAAVASDGLALQYASERLQRDPQIVAAAVHSQPGALSFSKLTGAEARKVELIAVREGGLIDERIARLGEKDFVLAFAEHLADNRYSGSVKLTEQIYRFEHHFEDPAFVRELLERLPDFLTRLPEQYWTPENLLTAAKRSASYIAPSWGVVDDPRLDPRNLPASTWEELARAFPREFVRRFEVESIGKADLPAFKRAVLAAIHQDHRAADSIPAAWWKDDAFVAAAVEQNALILRSFGPSRKRWLSELRPKSVAGAQRFLERLSESGFTLDRFEGRFPLLEAMIKNRFERGPKDDRPIAVVVYPKHDHNQAFSRVKFEKLTERYRVMYYEAGSMNEMASAIADGTRTGPAHVLVLAAHGSPESLQWGSADQRPDRPYQLRPEHTMKLAEMVPAERLAQNAKVIFDACAVGGGGKYRRNLVNCLGEVWPHVWLQAAWFNSSSGNKMLFYGDGMFDRMDFRNSDTLRPVPYHVCAPTRFDYGASSAEADGRGITTS